MSTTARKRTSQSLRSALCLLLALGMATLAPFPGAGAVAAFAEQQEGDAPTPQNTPSSDNPDEGPPADPAANPTDGPAADPSGDLVTNPADDAASSAAANPDEGGDGNSTGGPEAGVYAAPSAKGPGGWILGKVEDVAFDLASTVALKALGKAAEASGNDNLIKVVNFVDRKMGGEVEQECKEILAAVNDLSSQMQALENDIQAQFNALQRREILNQIENQRSEIIQMSDSVYPPALQAYNAYVQASADYSEAIGTSNEESRRQDVLTKERALVAAFNQVNYQDSLNTIEKNGVNMGSYANHRYLYNLDQYADQALAFDHQRFALITAGINDVVNNLGIVVYVQRLEYDYWSAKALAAPSDQALQQKVLDLENAIEANLQRVLQDVDYVVSEFANKDNLQNWPRTDLLSLIRPYDFETTYEFDYEESSNRVIYSKDGFMDFFHTTYPICYTAQKKKTAPTMDVYRAVVKGTPYLVLNGDVGLSFGQKQGDVAHGVRYWEKIHYFTPQYLGFPDQDLFNLLSTKDGLYRLPTTFDPLAPIVQQTSYASSNGSLAGFFKANGMDTIGRESYVLMNSYDDHIRSTGAFTQNHYTYFHVYSTAIPVNGNYSAAATNLFGEDTTPDYSMLAVLAPVQNEREAYPLHLLTEGSGLTITATDVDGNPLPERVPAGTRIKLSVSADDATALDSLVLRDAGGEVLQTLASSEVSNLVVGGAGSITQASFNLTMPYQEASLVGTPGKAEPNPLGFVEDADGAYLVSTLDDLTKVASAYDKSHAGVYRHAAFRLANDIENLRYPFPAWKTPIGSEASPFTGTFDGAGYGIGGFSMDMTSDPLKDETFGGLFGVIGQGGTVRNVKLYGAEFSGDPSKHIIGALAGVNNGMVQNCSTGTAQTGFRPSSGMLSSEELRLANAAVSAWSAGGLVGENSGDIVNCWSGATIKASEVDGRGGGLVGFSDTGSTVWNSYALGDVLGAANAGGVIGRNFAEVHLVYYAGALVDGTTKGSVVGANHHNVYDVYAADDVAGGNPFGLGWTGEGGSATLMTRSSMASQAFADTLNERVAGSMDYWAQREDMNHGLPYLVANPLIDRTIRDEATGIALNGAIHAGALLVIEPLVADDGSREALYEHAQSNGLLGELAASYRALLPVRGLKSQQTALEGPVTLNVPIPAAFAGRGITVLQEHANGIVALEAHVSEGVATVQVDTVTPFAVIVDDPSVPGAEPNAPGGTGASLAPTGDGAAGWLAALGALVAAAVGAVALSFRRLRGPKRK